MVFSTIIVVNFACVGNPKIITVTDRATDDNEPDFTESVRGMVVEVNSVSVNQLDTLNIKDLNGNTWKFEVPTGYEGFTPSHLREHMVQGSPVTVMFNRRNTPKCRDGCLIIEKITD